MHRAARPHCRRWRARIAGARVSILAVALLAIAWPPARASGEVSVPEGFAVTTFATGIGAPTALAFGPGGGFGGDLFVLDAGRFGGTGCVLRVDATGAATPFACSPLLEAPLGAAFDPTGAFGGDLFVALDTQPGSGVGGIARITSAGAVSYFANGFAMFPGLFGSADLAFGPGGAFGSDLYLADFEIDGPVNPPSAFGNVLRFAPDASFTSAVPFDVVGGADGLAFGAGGSFGSDLFVSDNGGEPPFTDGANTIVEVAPDGSASVFAVMPSVVGFTNLAFDRVGRFGGALFVVDPRDGTIFKVDPSRSVTPFVTGLASGVAGDLAFGPDGNLFITDEGGDRILEISAAFVVITTSAVPPAQLDQPFELDLAAVSGRPPYTWALAAGALPPGMTLGTDGVLGGRPTEGGTFAFTARVTDSSASTDEQDLTIEVRLAPPGAELIAAKTGTPTVPGRIVNYTVLVQNTSAVTAVDWQLFEPLEPWFHYVSATPAPVVATADALRWDLPAIAPGAYTLIRYSVRLDPATPFGQTVVGGPACPARRRDCAEHRAWCLNDAAQIKYREDCDQAFRACLRSGRFPNGQFDQRGRPTGFKVAHCGTDRQTVRIPVDPNEKSVAAERFVRPDAALVYSIHFENVGDVEARDVFVTDVLDPALDLSTVEILTPGGSLDPSTRTLRWALLGVDLPPGGTGEVLFAARPVPGLASGAEIRNDATIQFEIFTPMTTNEVVSTIDDVAPTCVVDPLPALETTPSFPLTWSATDPVGEVGSYSVFVSVDGGSFERLASGTPSSDMIFHGETGHTYSFACAAADTAGNAEVQGPVAEATTTIGALDFLCRRARPSRGEAFARTTGQALADWIQSAAYDVKKPLALCLPAGTGGAAPPATDLRLAAYRIKGPRGGPHVDVRVHDALGPHWLRTGKAERVLVPSATSPDGPPPPLSAPGDFLTCYTVSAPRKVCAAKPSVRCKADLDCLEAEAGGTCQRGFGKRAGNEVQISARDPFATAPKLFEVKRPTRLCAPADEDGAGVEDPRRHLLCYRVKRARGEARPEKRKGIHLGSPFGPPRIDASAELELCLPAWVG